MRRGMVRFRGLCVPPQRADRRAPSVRVSAHHYAVTPYHDRALGFRCATYRCECGELHTHRWTGPGCYSALCKKPPPEYRWLSERQLGLFDQPEKRKKQRR